MNLIKKVKFDEQLNRILFKKKKKYTNQEKREYLYETVVRQNRESKSRILGVFDCLFFFRSYVQLFKTHFKENVYFSITFFFFFFIGTLIHF